jgi:TM2 domain-containing membrane protein YozV
MDQKQMLMMLPGLEPEELMFIQNLTKDMTENQQQQFLMFYQGKRKDHQTLMFLTLLGFLGIAGIQRFVTGETGLGILYILTAGFCGIGTIIDLVNLRSLATQFNQKQAIESANMVQMMG